METPEAIVIGAGPAGMAAATRLARGGCPTLLIDEQPGPGGQIYRGIETASPRLRDLLGKDYLHGAALAARLRQSGARLSFSTAAWRLDPDGTIFTRSPEGATRHRPAHVVLAVGAIERPVPLPGWTLPGVMSIGGLQIALKTGGLKPRGRLVLAGNGPLLYLFASQCLAAGVSDIAILDTAPTTPYRAAPLLPRAALAGGFPYLRKGLGMLAAIRRSNIKFYRGVSAIAISGPDRAEHIAFTQGNRRHTLACDLVGLHEGVIPHQNATRSLALDHRWNPAQHCFEPILDPDGHTPLAHYWVAGDAGGIVGARAAEHQGRIAALSILKTQNRIAQDDFTREDAAERRGLAAHTAVRPLLDSLYPPRPETLLPDDGVTVCRCEAITAGQVRAAQAAGSSGPNQTKAFLRTGMGPCQGRMCGPTISALMHASGPSRDYFRIRPPLKPVPLSEIASLADSA